FDIVGIAETNCGKNKGQWYKDNKDKFRIHCLGNGKGTGVALIISKTLNKYDCKKREYKSRAICVDLVLPKKMTICVMQIYLPSKKSDKVNVINSIKIQLNEAQRKKEKVIVMEDFNAVPSPAIDRNNNSYSQFPESEIFPLLSSHDLIDCFRIMFPENTGYTWKRDNSNEESRIDAIWISHRWSDKITSCFLDDIKLITSSDHKLLGVKMLKKWQIKEKDEEIYSNGPKYNMKLMDKKQWLKFAELVNVERSLTPNIIKEFRIAKSLNKVYKLFNMEQAKSIKTIKNSETFKKEERKLNMLNYSMEKIFSRNNTNNFEIREELKAESLVHQKIAKAKEKSEIIKQIQKAIEKKWEDLKDNPKYIISSILDKPRKSIVMDRIVKEISDNNTIIIIEGSEIKELVKEHFHNWMRKRTTDAELFKK
ncbi:3977_t:CDS:2, partial [Diversispora eburnea]